MRTGAYAGPGSEYFQGVSVRSDRYEVIIERPRHGHWRRYPRQYAREPDVDLPVRESIGVYREKSLNEITARLSVGSAVPKHVMDHVKEC